MTCKAAERPQAQLKSRAAKLPTGEIQGSVKYAGKSDGSRLSMRLLEVFDHSLTLSLFTKIPSRLIVFIQK